METKVMHKLDEMQYFLAMWPQESQVYAYETGNFLNNTFLEKLVVKSILQSNCSRYV